MAFGLFAPLRAMLRCAVLTMLLTAGCSAPSGRVTRSECLAIAESYRTHRWRPTQANALHGFDPEGIRVDTPDIGYGGAGAFPGWWIPDQVNVGVPYQWGGFASPASFDDDIAAGKAAGDVYTAEKRRLLLAGVSRYATGIDCSGFISRCWKLETPCSTRELEAICEPLASWNDLRPGDVLNTFNSHVLLFAGWLDPARTRLVAYETGSPPHWLVVRHSIAVDFLKRNGFTPLRYRGMREG
jgi:hypothetical protein